jgi:hypothetical protein
MDKPFFVSRPITSYGNPGSDSIVDLGYFGPVNNLQVFEKIFREGLGSLNDRSS